MPEELLNLDPAPGSPTSALPIGTILAFLPKISQILAEIVSGAVTIPSFKIRIGGLHYVLGPIPVKKVP